MGRCISPIFGLFRYLWKHFLDVEGYGKEGKVHCNFVFVEVSEAFVCHAVFHLSEDGFRLYAASSAVSDSFL